MTTGQPPSAEEDGVVLLKATQWGQPLTLQQRSSPKLFYIAKTMLTPKHYTHM